MVLAGVAALAFTLDAILNPPYRVHFAAAGATIGLLAFGMSRFQQSPGYVLNASTWLALAATVPFLTLIRASGIPRAVSDAGGAPLSGNRVRAAQWLGLVALVTSVLVEGRTGLVALSPLWAALVGTGAYFSIGAPTRFPHSVHDPS